MFKLIFKSIWIKIKVIFSKCKVKVFDVKKYFKSYIESNDSTVTEYEDLAPTDHIEKPEKYIQALDWALHNDKIHNIALTGPYGSGKSSIIKTYKKERTHHHYLNISLASFYEEKIEYEEIEKGILQQLFYKVKNSKLPYSRFKKIHNISFIKMFIEISVFLLSALFGSILIFPSLIERFKNNYVTLNKYFLNNYFISAIYITFGVFIIIEISFAIRYLGIKFSLSKLKVKEIELSSKENDEDSIINKYLDEILYYFEVTKYDVVFIEDLDRFNNTKIFIKLRELNTLINNSEQINRRVVFIYAVKDDMFSNKDRTKFFDFIIPVIPVIDATNSNEILLKKVKSENITAEYINGVSVYIDDFRLLTNICNEFTLYINILDDISLKKDKMFSIIIYKNLYPEDFAKLQYGQGMVYEAFAGKRKFVAKKISELDEKINSLEIKLINVESDGMASLTELKSALIYNMTGFKLINEIRVNYEQRYRLDTIMNDSFDLNLLNGKELTITFYNGDNIKSSLKVADSKSGSEKTYLERWHNLKGMTSERKKELLQEIEEYKIQKRELSSKRLKYLISKYGTDEILSERIKKEKPIVYLLRNGYIDETYQNYLTHFYSNSVTADDMDFILSVRNYERIGFDYKLNKIKQLIVKLNTYEFKQKEILNFQLFAYLLDHENEYNKQINEIINQLSDEEEVSFQFIDEFSDLYSENQDIFFKKLCHTWPGIWGYVISKKNITLQTEIKFLKIVVKYAECNDIVEIQKTCKNKYKEHIDFKDYILRLPDFLKIVREVDVRKIKDTIKKLNLKFYNINNHEEDKEIIKFIIDNNFYIVNEKMLKLGLRVKSNVNLEKFEEANFTTIKNSGYDELITNIRNNMDLYINEVFLKMKSNTKEDLDSILEILAYDEEILDEETKIKVIIKEDFMLDDINKVQSNLWNIIFEQNKIRASWENVIKYFVNNKKLNEILKKYMENNLSALENEIFNPYYADEDIKNMFMQQFLISDLSEACYESILKVLNIKVNVINIDAIKRSHVKILIDNKYFELSSDIFNVIKNNHSDLHIDYALSYKDEFVKDLEKYTLDDHDLLLILKSSLTDDEKINIVNKIHISIVTKDVAKLIFNIIDRKAIITRELFDVIWNSIEIQSERLLLLTTQINKMPETLITEYLNELGEKFNEITLSRKRVKIEYSEQVYDLAQELEQIHYISSKDIIEKDDKKYVQFNTPNRE